MSERPASASQVESVEVMTAVHANPSGAVHGGVLLQLIDRIGSIAGVRHSEGRCTTAAVDGVTFHAPSRVGDILTIRAVVVDAGRTSMAVRVTVTAERMEDRSTWHVATGHLSLVAVDGDGRPRPVPGVVAETPEQQEAQAAAQARRAAR